jgi:hypothetical protein
LERVLKWKEYKYVYPSTDKYRMNERIELKKRRGGNDWEEE